MRKNVASQFIGAEMITAADGTAFTGTVSALVTKDGGTQTAGGGTVTHKGNGYHSYALTQAETNADHVAVTFTGTGAIPATVQVYTGFPQTGDNFARIGAPAGASVSADIAAVKSDTAGALTRLPAALVGGRMDSSVGAIATGAITATSIAASALNGKGDWNIGKTGYSLTQTFPTNFASMAITVGGAVTVGTNSDKTGYTLTAGPLDAAGVRAAVGLAAANLDTQIATLATSASLATTDGNVSAIKAKTDSLTYTVAGQVDANIQSINDVTITGNGQVGTEFGV